MNNKEQIAVIAAATLFASAIPASAIAASASLILSNINITATPLDATSSIIWDYSKIPDILKERGPHDYYFDHTRDITFLHSESMYWIFVPDLTSIYDVDMKEIGGIGPSASARNPSYTIQIHTRNPHKS